MGYTIEGWIDEMNILRSDKKRRIKTAKNLERQLVDFFLRQLSDMLDGVFLITVSSETYRGMLTDIYMAQSERYEDEWMQDKARRFANQIQGATESIVRGIECAPEFTQAIMFGIPMRKRDIPQKVLGGLSMDRSAKIAMHETNVIHNYIHHMELKETQITHTWDATLDGVTRPHHWNADGLTVPIDEPFVVGGEMMMFPGDDSLGATARNLINCRCVEL